VPVGELEFEQLQTGRKTATRDPAELRRQGTAAPVGGMILLAVAYLVL